MAEVIQRPPGTIPFADTERWKGGFGVQSDSNPDVLYTISFDTAGGGYWVCSCPAGKNRGECKHLKRYNRSPTRADAKRAIEQAEADAIRDNEARKEARQRLKDLPTKAGFRKLRSTARTAVWVPDAPTPQFEPSPVGAAPPRIPGDLTIPIVPPRKFRAPGEV